MEAAESSARALKGVRAATSMAIVGGSDHAAAIVRLLVKLPGVSITSVCAEASQPAGRFAEASGIRLVGEPLDALASDPAPDIVLDLSEDVVTRAALESALPPSTELLGGASADLLLEVLSGAVHQPPEHPRQFSELAQSEAIGRARRMEASNAALARANRDLEARLAEVYFMHEFVKALVAYRRIEDVSSVVVDACAGIVGADLTAVYILDREEWVLRLAQVQGRPMSGVTAEVQLSDPLFGLAVSEGSARLEDGQACSAWLASGSGRVRTQVALALRAGGEPIGVLALGWSAHRGLETPELERLRVMADQSALSLQNALLHAELEQMSVTDRLTELFNHGYVTQRLDQELGRAGRFGHPLSVIMLDIDDFKGFNDRYGHIIGDEVLRSVSKLIRENLREMDVAARYGGEEFLVLVPETGPRGARAVADRIRESVANNVFLRDAAGEDVHASVSVGVATFPAAGETVESLIRAADDAMYAAKRAGKNRVTLSDLNPDTGAAEEV